MKRRLLITLCFILTFGTIGPVMGGGFVHAAGKIIHVKVDGDDSADGTDWVNAFATLQKGLEIATAGDEIWIAEGTYYPTNKVDATDDRTATFQMINGVTIQGGFPASGDPDMDERDIATYETILSGDLNKDDDAADPTTMDENAYHVFYHPNGTNLDDTAVLDGVTISDGNANGSADYMHGGGMYNKGSSPRLMNVDINNNIAIYGGGMFNTDSNPELTNVKVNNNKTTNDDVTEGGHGGGIYNTSSSPKLTNVTINDNVALRGGGIHNEVDSNPILVDVIISKNRSTYDAGGGIYNNGSSPKLTDVTIRENQSETVGAGIYNGNKSNSQLVSVLIIDNQAKWSGGGVFNHVSSPELTNVLISGNTAVESGGGIENRTPTSNPILINVTISGNSANDGGGIYNVSGDPVINNSIIWGNSNNLINKQTEANPKISYSLIGGSGGNDTWNPDIGTDEGSNLDEDPLFADASSGDYRLHAASPAINAGSNGYISMWNTEDLAGNTRIFDSIVDMGAYEFQGQAAINEAPVINASDQTLQVGDTFDELAGVTASDAEDGDVTSEISVTKNEVDTTTAGVYDVTYEVTDSDGETTTKTITVTVEAVAIPNEAPVIDASDQTITVGDPFDELAGVTATDTEDGDLTAEIAVTKNDVDTSTAGEYDVTYEVTDSDGETTSKTIIVTVEEAVVPNESPEIDASDQTITVGDAFDALDGVTATDAEDGDVTSEILVTKNEVDTATAGVYDVTYEVTDSDGETTTKTITVTVEAAVVPNEAPEIDASDQTITVGDTFDALDGVTARDAEDGDVTSEISVTKNEVDTATAGVYDVTYEVTDSDGETTRKTITVTIEADDITPPTEREVTQVEVIPGVTVDKGIAKGDLDLPTEVMIELDNGDLLMVDVIWDEGTPKYNQDEAGKYEFFGKLVLPDGINNTEGIKARTFAKIEEEITDPTDPIDPTDPTKPEDPETTDPSDNKSSKVTIEPEGDDTSKVTADPSDGDSSKITIESEDNESDGSTKNKLPKTATNMYTWMLLGLILIGIAGALMIFRKKSYR